MHAKRMRGEASRRKRRRESGSSIETRKPATLRPRKEHHFLRTAGTPCWFSYFQGGYMTIVKVPPQIADLRREVLAATTVVSCPVFAPVKRFSGRNGRPGGRPRRHSTRGTHTQSGTPQATQQPTASDPEIPPQEPARNHASEGRSAHQPPTTGPAAASSSSPNSAIVAAATSPSSRPQFAIQAPKAARRT